MCRINTRCCDPLCVCVCVCACVCVCLAVADVHYDAISQSHA